jgi:phage major head subunit gpT-like protein
MLINRSNISSINIAINDAFMSGMEGYTDKGLYKEVCYIGNSTAKSTEYGWLASMPKVREWIGDRHIGNIGRYGLQVNNKSYEDTVHLLREEIEDDTWANKINIGTALGEEVERHKNEMVFGLMGQGFTQLAYDGQPFFDANHPIATAAGGTQLVSNIQAGAGAPWYLLDLSSSVFRPFIYQTRRDFSLKAMMDEQDEQVFMRDEYRWGVDGRVGAGLALWQKALGSRAVLNAANFDAAVAQMGTVVRDGGGPAAVRATHLVCGYSNRAAARTLLETQNIAVAIGTAAATISNANFGAVKLIVTPYLP